MAGPLLAASMGLPHRRQQHGDHSYLCYRRRRLPTTTLPTDYAAETVDLASYKSNDLHDSTVAVASRASIFRTSSASQAAQGSRT